MECVCFAPRLCSLKKDTKSSEFGVKKLVYGRKIYNKHGGGGDDIIFVVRSGGRESEYEIDQDKAREALKRLDQQLQSISDKPINPPKIRAAEVEYTREQAEQDRTSMQSTKGLADGSFQASLVAVLLVFSIFYNVIFITIIKPSIDGPDSPLPANEEAPKAAVLLQ